MRFRALGAAVVVAGAGLAAVVAFVPGNASAGSDSAAVDSVATLRHAVLDGSLDHDRGLVDGCVMRGGDRTYDLGCDHALVASAADPGRPAITATPAGLGPGDLARAFDLPSTPGRSGTIGIITAAGDPNLAADLATYRAQYQLPACTADNGCLSIVGIDGGAPPAPTANLPGLISLAQSYTEESTLDVEQASAACPDCKLVVVEQPIDLVALGAAAAGFPQGSAQNEVTATNTAIKLGATAVSSSYFIGNGLQSNILTSAPLADEMHHPGIAMVEASGDIGYLGTSPNAQNWPQELPWVTSAGGVELTSSDNGQTFTPTAWGKVEINGKYMSSSSGCATMLPPANGQPASVAALCGGHRASADIAAASSNLAIYDTYFPQSGGSGGWGIAVGTSAASPYIAGLYARTGTAGVDGPNTLYAAPAGAIQNVTTGSNMQNGAAGCSGVPAALCVAGPGWNGPTGLGVPHGLAAF